MPDTGASRKRQIQVALRPFGGIAATGAARHRILHAAALFCRRSCRLRNIGAACDRSAVSPDAAKIRRRRQGDICCLEVLRAFEIEVRDSNSLARTSRFLEQPRAISRRGQCGFRFGMQKHSDRKKYRLLQFSQPFHRAAGLAVTSRNSNVHLSRL